MNHRMGPTFERIRREMTGWRRVLVLVAALALINGMTWIVVKENQRNGVYPIEADSIGLPIFSTLLISFLVLPVLVSIGLLTDTQWMDRCRSRGRVWGVIIGTFLLALYVVAALFSLGGAGYWLEPGHYAIAFCYLLLGIALGLCLLLDGKWLRQQDRE